MSDGLSSLCRGLVLTLLEERLHALDAIGNVEIKGLLAELLGEDELVDVDRVQSSQLKTPEKSQQECETCQALLTVDDERPTALLGDDDGSQIVARILGYILARVTRLVQVEELRGQIVNEFSELLGLPLVLALVVVDRVLLLLQHFGDSLCDAVNTAIAIAIAHF